MNDKHNRRNFLKTCGFSTVPLIIPSLCLNAFVKDNNDDNLINSNLFPVNFIYDGLVFSPDEYIGKLQEINKLTKIEPDFYGKDGATKEIEEQFAKITGKEKAIYLPTGTMANQIAVKLLNNKNTKAIVPENSHIYRDEADAAQSVHGIRLVPAGKEKPFYELSDLKELTKNLNEGEIYDSGLGTVVIENPIRRADETLVPIKTIREISEYCKEKNYKMHLDGARLHIASAYSKVPIQEYCSYFDTIYISLYKYLNANSGAILCGDSKIIDQAEHQIKILGGNEFRNWHNTAMALHYLIGINERLNKVIETSKNLISELNKIKGISITTIKNGTNIFYLNLSDKIDFSKFAKFLYREYNILIRNRINNGIVNLTINESILTRNINDIVNAWKKGIEYAVSE